MRTLGISIARLDPSEVELAMAHSAQFTQQNGFVHGGIITAGLDTACGIAAFTLMPPGADILTVEFKTNLLAPARGERVVFRAHVVKPGRTLTVCEARDFAEADGVENLVATMTGTLMALMPRHELPRSAGAPARTADVAAGVTGGNIAAALISIAVSDQRGHRDWPTVRFERLVSCNQCYRCVDLRDASRAGTGMRDAGRVFARTGRRRRIGACGPADGLCGRRA